MSSVRSQAETRGCRGDSALRKRSLRVLGNCSRNLLAPLWGFECAVNAKDRASSLAKCQSRGLVVLKERTLPLNKFQANQSLCSRPVCEILQHRPEVDFTVAAPVVPDTLDGSLTHAAFFGRALLGLFERIALGVLPSHKPNNCRSLLQINAYPSTRKRREGLFSSL